jgi:hypothetical protein
LVVVPVAVPRANDLQVPVALHERLGLEFIFGTDGFNTLEFVAEESIELEWVAEFEK